MPISSLSHMQIRFTVCMLTEAPANQNGAIVASAMNGTAPVVERYKHGQTQNKGGNSVGMI